MNEIFVNYIEAVLMKQFFVTWSCIDETTLCNFKLDWWNNSWL